MAGKTRAHSVNTITTSASDEPTSRGYGLNASATTTAGGSSSASDPNMVSRALFYQMLANANRPERFSGKKIDFPVFVETMEAYISQLDMSGILDSDTPDPVANKALYNVIIGCLNPDSVKIVATNAKHDGKLAWEVLAKHHLGDDKARRKVALLQLHKLQMRDSEDVQTFLTRVDLLKKTLTSLKLLQDDDMIIISVIDALPHKYEHLKMFLTGEDFATYSALKNAVISQITRLTASVTPVHANVMSIYSSPGASNYSAQVYKPRSNNFKKQWPRQHAAGEGRSSSSTNTRSKERCTRCYCLGHTVDTCHSTRFCTVCKIYGHHTSRCTKVTAPQSGHGQQSGRRGTYNSRSRPGRAQRRGRSSRNNHYSNNVTATESPTYGSPDTVLPTQSA